MQGTWIQSLGWEDPLEKETATFPVLLPGGLSEEPDRLRSMGLQRVGHDWATNPHTDDNGDDADSSDDGC